MAGGVEYQVTKVDPTDPETKGMVYQVHKVTEEIAATLGGKVYRARIINNPTEPTVVGKVYQIVLIDDPDDPSVKGKVYNAILTGGSEAVIVGPGVSPLSLPDAVAEAIDSLIAFGGTEQRSVLPDGYTQLDYIESSGTQYIDTGVEQGSASTYQTDVIYEYTDSNYSSTSVCGNYGITVSSWGQPYGGDGKVWCGYPNAGHCGVTLGAGVKYYDSFKVDVVNGTITRTFNGNTYSDSGITFTPPAGKCALFGCFINNSTSVSQFAKIKCYGFKIYKDDVLVLNFIPARRNSDSVLGMYDTVSQTFFTNQGTGDFVAGADVIVPTPDAPMNIICNNGVLTLSPNMTNYGDSSWKNGYFTTNGSIGGANTGQDEMYCETYYPVTAGDKYTLSFSYGGDTLPSNTWCCFAFYDSSKNFISRSANSASIAQNPKTYTVTIPSGCAYIRISLRTYKSGDNAVYSVQLEKGASATTYHPYGVYANGTVETISVHTKNLLNTETSESEKYVDEYGELANFSGWYASDFIQVFPNTNYYFQPNSTAGASAKHCYYDANKNFISYVNSGPALLSTPSNCKYVRVSYRDTSSDVQFEQGSSATTYVPYFDGGTAVAEILLKIDSTYTDQQEIISGTVTRKVGTKVLDGTESWQGSDGSPYYINIPELTGATSRVGLSNYFECTNTSAGQQGKFHFGGGTVNGNVVFSVEQTWATKDAFTTWLAQKYAAGTPVILIYPLATAATETVTGQPMETTEGDNIVEITQASMDGLELRVTYEKEA